MAAVFVSSGYEHAVVQAATDATSLGSPLLNTDDIQALALELLLHRLNLLTIKLRQIWA